MGKIHLHAFLVKAGAGAGAGTGTFGQGLGVLAAEEADGDTFAAQFARAARALGSAADAAGLEKGTGVSKMMPLGDSGACLYAHRFSAPECADGELTEWEARLAKACEDLPRQGGMLWMPGPFSIFGLDELSGRARAYFEAQALVRCAGEGNGQGQGKSL